MANLHVYGLKRSENSLVSCQWDEKISSGTLRHVKQTVRMGQKQPKLSDHEMPDACYGSKFSMDAKAKQFCRWKLLLITQSF